MVLRELESINIAKVAWSYPETGSLRRKFFSFEVTSEISY